MAIFTGSIDPPRPNSKRKNSSNVVTLRELKAQLREVHNKLVDNDHYLSNLKPHYFDDEVRAEQAELKQKYRTLETKIKRMEAQEKTSKDFSAGTSPFLALARRKNADANVVTLAELEKEFKEISRRLTQLDEYLQEAVRNEAYNREVGHWDYAAQQAEYADEYRTEMAPLKSRALTLSDKIRHMKTSKSKNKDFYARNIIMDAKKEHAKKVQAHARRLAERAAQTEVVVTAHEAKMTARAAQMKEKAAQNMLALRRSNGALALHSGGHTHPLAHTVGHAVSHASGLHHGDRVAVLVGGVLEFEMMPVGAGIHRDNGYDD